MMRKIYFITFIFILIHSLSYPQATKQFNDPLVFDTTIIDVGTIISDTTIQKKFTFKNNGKDSLKITGIDKSCRCSGLTVSKKSRIFKPGEEGNAIMTVDLQNKDGTFMVWGILITNTEQKYYKISILGKTIK